MLINVLMKFSFIKSTLLALSISLMLSACSSCGGSKDPNNTKLLGIVLSQGTLSPTFSPEIESYTASIPITTNEITAIITPEDKYATLKINGNGVEPEQESLPIKMYMGTNTLTIDVTSANKGHQQTYTVTVVRQMPPFADTLIAPDTVGSGEKLGSSMSVYEDTLVSGAPYQDNGATLRAGAVYIYSKASGSWVLEQKLSSPSPSQDEWFGYSVSIVANTIAVGAPNEDTDQIDSGAVYIFKKSGSTWSFDQTIKAETPTSGGTFGFKTIIAGYNMMISEPGASVGTDNRAGVIHLYDNQTGTAVWKQTIDIGDYTPKANNYMGKGLAFNGLIMVAGAPGNGGSLGWIYFFSSNGTTWYVTARIPDPTFDYTNASFGKYISLHSSAIAVGVPFQDTIATNSGAIYVCSPSGCTPTPIKSPDPEANENFGTGVWIYNDLIIAGAPGKNGGQGAIYAISQDANSAWSIYSDALAPDDVQAGEGFGELILGTSTGSIFVGSPLWNSDLHSDVGACYVME